MRTCFRAYLLPVLLVSLLMTGCSDPSGRPLSDMKKRMDVEVGAVQKAAVLSTDGQEVPLDPTVFLNDLPAQGKELEVSDAPLRREDVRYTLILYRKVEAPLVLEVGEQAVQFGDKTYRGDGTERFYRWIRQLTGKALLQSTVRSGELSAKDVARSLSLPEQEAVSLWQILQTSEYLDALEEKQYPLYPHYRVKMDTGSGVVEVTVLTPTIVSIPFGKETHFYRTHSSLFSTITEWLPPHEAGTDPFEALFRASDIRIDPVTDRSIPQIQRKMTDSTVDQAISHQCIRLLKSGILQRKQTRLPRQEQYRISFGIGNSEKVVRMYEDHFVLDGNVYSHTGIHRHILQLLEAKRK